VASERRVICSNCGTENGAERKFCKECAARLALVCPSCGAANSADAKFCGDCATPLVEGASPSVYGPSRIVVPTLLAAPVAEHRLVSVLFADLVGFTTLAEGRDADDTREFLTRYFDLARDVIGRYGGTVEKFIGDAVMAVWGAPTAHEDDAERAVRAGLELVNSVKTLGSGIAARAGVLTGEAAVTLGAAGQGMVAGDLVNTASRLQAVAPTGAVLVGEATARAASAAIVFEPAGEQTLKGKIAPVPAWRALRVVAERGGRNRTETLEAPFVGRDDELRLLKDLFHATTRERRARLVSITGIGGIGKTRLAWEFEKYLDGLVEPIWRHEGRSPAYGEGITFWALGEMVRRRAGLVETDDERTTRTKVAETVARHVPDAAERRWVEPALLALLGIDAGAVDSEQLFGAWRMFFERLAATGTVVLVFEDLQWADPGLLDFIDALLEWSRGFPIFVLTLARPELLERHPDLGAGKRSFTSLFLEPLPTAVMRELLAGLVPGLPEAAVAAIVERADGVPLYAVETVRMLLAEGKLTLEGGVYRPIGDLASLAVPETLSALIASRLDGLGPADRRLLCDAAVLGQSFTLTALAAVSAIPGPELEPRLRSLVRREFLVLETDPRSPERGQYAFVQSLVREVAYNTLAKRDRKARHLAAVRFFESLGSDELAGALAGHYLAAHRNAPEGPEADAVAAQARIALRAAAERAIALGSYDQALTFLDQALSVTTDPGETAALLERAGDAASAAGHYEAADRHLRQATSMQRELGDRAAIARATAALGRALLSGWRAPEALALLAPAADEFADLAADPAGIALGGQLARAYFLTDDNRRAIEVADQVLEAAEHSDLPEIVADTLVTRGTALAWLGRPIEGLALLAAGQQLAEAHGLVANRAYLAHNNRSGIESIRDPRAALEIAQAGLARARRLGRRGMIAVLLANAADRAFRTGDWAWALAELEAALTEEFEAPDRAGLLGNEVLFRALRGEAVADQLAEITRLVGDSDDPRMLSLVVELDACVAFAAGRLGDARTAFRRDAELLEANGPWSLPPAARAALWVGDGAAARDDLAALDGSGFHGPAVEADRRTIRAGIAALEGRPADALPLYREALRGWRDLGLAWDEALCGLDMATLLDPAEPEVRAAAEAAREILVRLEAAPFIARLDAALAGPPDRAGHSALPTSVDPPRASSRSRA
jgi:class 3 adenylate cyclase/tetratricopeptide (TPR) repeat protein